MAITLLAKISNLAGLGKSLFATDKTKIGEILIDATHMEEIHYSNTITDHPVSGFGNISGAYVSDHYYRNPLRLKINGSITEDSIDVIGTAQNIIGLLDGNVLNNVVNKYKGKGRNQLTAFKVLNDLCATGTFIDVVCYWDSFSNMVIEDLKFPKDQQTGNRLYFEVSLKQMTLASVKTIVISNNPRSTQDLITNKVKLGAQETTTPTPTQETKARSTTAGWLF